MPHHARTWPLVSVNLYDFTPETCSKIIKIHICFFQFKSSSIIWSVILSSSSKLPHSTPALFLAAVLQLGEAAACSAAGTSCSCWVPLLLMLFPRSTVMTQLETERGPARFCHTPIWEFSVSSLKHVSEGDGDLQHFRSFALKIAESDDDDDDDDEDDPDWSCAGLFFSVLLFLSSVGCGACGGTGKFVLAFRPLISTAASSYALAASSAVSNVPSHTLLFLHTRIHKSKKH